MQGIIKKYLSLTYLLKTIHALSRRIDSNLMSFHLSLFFSLRIVSTVENISYYGDEGENGVENCQGYEEALRGPFPDVF